MSEFEHPNDLEEVPIPHWLWYDPAFLQYIYRFPGRPWIICRKFVPENYDFNEILLKYRNIYRIREYLTELELDNVWEQFYIVFLTDDYGTYSEK